MSRSKDASMSKKRKLSRIEQNESAPTPRKARVASRKTTGGDGALDGGSDEAAVPARMVRDDELVADSEGGLSMKRKTDWEGSGFEEVEAAAIAEAGEEQRLEFSENVVAAQQDLHNESKDKAASRQAKSERRSKKKQKSEETDMAVATVEASTPIQQTDPTVNEATSNPQDARAAPNPPSSSRTKPEAKQRFIVFIGNLPYSATTPSISSHFSKLLPFTVRHSTDKATGRSRGFAFLEFESYDRMKTCLKVYHHSLFDPPAGGDGSGEKQQQQHQQQGARRKKSQARKINVELTAGGGGGKSGVRKERIRGKNEKLGEERERARVQKSKEEGGAGMRDSKEKTGANAVEVTNGEGDENIHPSRRKRVKT